MKESDTMTVALPPPALTFDQLMQGFQEVRQMFLATDRKFQETDLIMKASSAEFDRIMKANSAETDRIMKESSAKFDREIQETNLILKKLSRKLGDLGNRLGEFVEYMVSPAVVRLFQSLGIEVHTVYPGIESHRNGEGIEIDLLVVNDGVLVAVECKSKLTKEHVDEHLIRMEKLKRLLPEFRQHRALGAVAAMVMTDEVKHYAHQNGLYVLYQNGEALDVSNPEGFTPSAW
jgi:hypothetical protein